MFVISSSRLRFSSVTPRAPETGIYRDTLGLARTVVPTSYEVDLNPQGIIFGAYVLGMRELIEGFFVRVAERKA